MDTKKINPEAWDSLREDERTSITLSLGHNKSSWEAGEIMGKAHYKYLEIQARAERFLKLFTEYFSIHGVLIPPQARIPRHFEEYLYCVVIQRKSIKDAINYLDDGRYKVTSSRERVIEEAMGILVEKKNIEPYGDLLGLILEFDRWNNFRILPKVLQQPSAFKRRNKSRELKHLRGLQNLPDFSIHKIIERYETPTTRANKLYLYVPLLTEARAIEAGDTYYIMKVEHNATNVNHLSRLGLFIFGTFPQAEEFADVIDCYTTKRKSKTDSKVMNGQRFWPKFRDFASRAINYEMLNNIIPNRKFIEDAYIEMELKISSKNRPKL